MGEKKLLEVFYDYTCPWWTQANLKFEETMAINKSATLAAAIVLTLQTPAFSANFTINNPAANIYNPAATMDNPNPLSPPTQPVRQPKVEETEATKIPAEQIKIEQKPKPAVPLKNYNFKAAGTYINAANKAFNREDYVEFLSITEDALRRIHAGTLTASKATVQKLNTYKITGYGLLGKGE